MSSRLLKSTRSAWTSAASRVGERGFSLLELLIAFVALGVMMAGIAQYMQRKAIESKDEVTSAQLRDVSKGLADYIIANRNTLIQAVAANGGAPVVLDFNALRVQGYFTPAVQPVNAYGQSYALLVRYVGASNTLQGLVVTQGGHPIPEGALQKIASRAGGSGGFASSNVAYAGRWQGAFGGWSVNFADFASTGVNTAPGYLAASANFGANQVNQNYLYRFNMGDAELNTMRTGLNLGGNNMSAGNITSSGTVTTTTLNATNGNFTTLNAGTINGQQP